MRFQPDVMSISAQRFSAPVGAGKKSMADRKLDHECHEINLSNDESVRVTGTDR
jgi:hypothetical protein